MAVVRAAVVQATPVPFDCESTLGRMEALTREAAGRGARLAVFPEAFVGGYPKGTTFGTVVGERSPEGREEFRRYFDAARPAYSWWLVSLSEMAELYTARRSSWTQRLAISVSTARSCPLPPNVSFGGSVMDRQCRSSIPN